MRLAIAIVVGWCGVTTALAAQQPPIPPPTIPPATPAAPVPVPVPAQPPAPPAGPAEAPPPPPPPATESKEKESEKKSVIEITLGAESKGVTPYTHGDAKTEEGAIDVSTDGNVLKAVMTGGVGANVFFGFESIASQSFQLVQEFEITSSDPNVREVVLTFDSGVVGFVRCKHKASACVTLANVVLAPAGASTATFSVSHPQICVAGPNPECRAPLGAMNKDPQPQMTSGPLPLGRYVLQANFMLQATAAGILDAHSTAIFAPEPKELDPWEREHDPYKGEEKEGYGFTTIVTATPANGKPSADAWKKVQSAAKVAKRPNGRRAVR